MRGNEPSRVCEGESRLSDTTGWLWLPGLLGYLGLPSDDAEYISHSEVLTGLQLHHAVFGDSGRLYLS